MSNHITRTLLNTSRECIYIEPPKRYTKHAIQRNRERTGGIEVIKKEKSYGPEVVITVLPRNAINIVPHRKKKRQERSRQTHKKQYRRSKKHIKCGIIVKTFKNRPDVIVTGWTNIKRRKKKKRKKKLK